MSVIFDVFRKKLSGAHLNFEVAGGDCTLIGRADGLAGLLGKAFQSGSWKAEWVFFSGLIRVGVVLLLMSVAPGIMAKEMAVELALFRDASGVMPLEQVLELGADAFEPCGSEFPVVGFTADAIWLRARVVNDLEVGLPLVAELGVARLKQVQWEAFVEGGDRFEPLRLVDLGLREPTVSFELPAQKAGWILVKVTSDTSMHLPLRVWAAADFPAVATKWSFLEFTSTALGMGIVAFAVGMGVFARERAFYLAALHMLLYQVYLLLFDGYISWLWPGAPRWMETNLLACISALVPGIHLFIMLEWQQSNQDLWVLNRFVRPCAWSALGLGLVYAMTPFTAVAWLNSISSSVFFLLGAGSSIVLALRKRTLANGLMALAWTSALGPGTLMLARLHHVAEMVIPIEPRIILRFYFPVVSLVTLSAIVVQASRNVSERERRLQAEQATTLAQLEALRYQINPHFLYNVLGAIDALAHEAPARLSMLVGKLATFLRMRLLPSPDHLTTVRDEMEAVHAYLAIEKVRFEERLEVVEKIEEAALVCQVPELLLQSLVENAVKYSQSEDGVCRVWLEVSVVGDRLHLVVENMGSLGVTPRRAMSNTGIGHSNLRGRLNLHYANQASFSIVELEGRVQARANLPKTIHIPIRCAA